jgi:hypothetical protein
VCRRKLRIAVGLAKIFQILAVVFGTEIDWHTHRLSFYVKVDMYSRLYEEYITSLYQPGLIGVVLAE